MPPIRPARPVSGYWSPKHVPNKLSTEPPVTSAQPLWRLVKEGHVAEARVRPIEGVGVELRYEWNGELRVSRIFKAWEAPRGCSNGEAPGAGGPRLARRPVIQRQVSGATGCSRPVAA